jgi:predicted secreted Zn-dependent protease
MLFCYENGLLDVLVDANFSPRTSWVRLKDETDQLLEHEQGHFDITELYARKLRKAIRDAQIRCNDGGKETKGHLLINRLRKEYKIVERNYDTETKHGADSGRQSRASDQIESYVAALSAYKQ